MEKIYKMRVLPRIVRFGLIFSNDFVKINYYVLTKVEKCNKREFKVLICVSR